MLPRRMSPVMKWEMVAAVGVGALTAYYLVDEPMRRHAAQRAADARQDATTKDAEPAAPKDPRP